MDSYQLEEKTRNNMRAFAAAVEALQLPPCGGGD